jgi:hypothetical protein
MSTYPVSESIVIVHAPHERVPPLPSSARGKSAGLNESGSSGEVELEHPRFMRIRTAIIPARDNLISSFIFLSLLKMF